MTRNNTGITRRDVPRDVASRSRLSGAGLHNATYCSCSTELKNKGNGTAAPETARGRKRASLQTPSLTYLTSLDCKTTMLGDIHKSSSPLLPMDFHHRVLPVSRPLHSVPFATPVYWFIPLPSSSFSSTSGSTFSQAVCAARRERLSAAGGRRRLVASLQTRIKRAIDVGKSPGNLPARLLS